MRREEGGGRAGVRLGGKEEMVWVDSGKRGEERRCKKGGKEDFRD